MQGVRERLVLVVSAQEIPVTGEGKRRKKNNPILDTVHSLGRQMRYAGGVPRKYLPWREAKKKNNPILYTVQSLGRQMRYAGGRLYK